ncbi:nucleotidyl transferase AbiEii/AbiGii toxin family protein [Cellulophaga baltica]|uniref:Nucleotidyl transferase AbiEii toxin, Type IV TA system n=1 Tax=Cellulophaga baltica TaxID=76594 RepID=A0A1G7JP90_9FLAO|nr:nucleotidyl transferase AbiEii/AbiGii toxin family protein [Cellulophaga baltica]SDF26762.1 Nucleotidyl transferase AbiEii toxin, Type IV TA system [Cellulophaga baltica]
MKLHENKVLFKQSIAFTAQQMKILPIYVEKDYWVTYALSLIFKDAIGTEAIFKGGTALSKCFGLIERFSEDIDLVVLKGDEESGNQLKNKLKKITNVVGAKLTEVNEEGITNKVGMIRKIAYQYPKTFSGKYGQVRENIIVEATWLGHYEPFQNSTISSYVYDMMEEAGQHQLAEEYGLLPFEVQVLHVNRTICEKIMSLVRFSYGVNPLLDLKNKIRHTYDLHQLLKVSEIYTFFESPDFEAMLLQVGEDDIESFKNNNEWLAFHPKEATLFREPEATWKELENGYTNEFGNLVYGELPSSKEVLETIQKISKRLQAVKWNIEIPEKGETK